MSRYGQRPDEEKKAKIRKRYKGVSPEKLEIIPAVPQPDFYDDETGKRVAVYARVSTDDPRQTSSYELQKNYYMDYVRQHPNWELVDIYADEGISGTSLRHRDEFNRMIADCKKREIDLIVTKSVSRFARNLVDCVGLVQQLAALTPPVGIFFEAERLYTLNSNCELSLSFIAAIAQEESHIKSTVMNASIEMRFNNGIFLTPPLLGYDQDEEGELVINQEEAKTVRLIFFMYLYGYSCSRIAETLTMLGRPTKRGNLVWNEKSVLNILQNERRCGEVLARKTYTPNYLDHKAKKNRGARTQYRYKKHHEAIISPDDFVAVQRLISNAKYGNQGFLPQLHVIMDGALKGFVSINPRWASFHAADYIAASDSAAEALPETVVPFGMIEVQRGDFDLRGFETARAQFFNIRKKVCVTFSRHKIVFSQAGIDKLEGTPHVELLIHPTKRLLAVRPCGSSVRNKVRWAKQAGGRACARVMCGTAYLRTVFELLGWNTSYKYRVHGLRRERGEEAVLLFDLHDTEVLIPAVQIRQAEQPETAGCCMQTGTRMISTACSGKEVVAYPLLWKDSFGAEYYCQARELEEIDQKGLWNIADEGKPYYEEAFLQITGPEELEQGIQQIMDEFRKREQP